MITSFGGTNVFKNDTSNICFKANSIRVQKIDNNNAKLYCDALKTSNGSFLLSKTQNSDGFEYDISNLTKTQKYYSFNSTTNINFDEGIHSKSHLINVGAYMLSKGATVAGFAATGFSIMGKAKTIADIGALTAAVVGAGATSAANGFGWFVQN